MGQGVDPFGAPDAVVTGARDGDELDRDDEDEGGADGTDDSVSDDPSDVVAVVVTDAAGAPVGKVPAVLDRPSTT